MPVCLEFPASTIYHHRSHLPLILLWKQGWAVCELVVLGGRAALPPRSRPDAPSRQKMNGRHEPFPHFQLQRGFWRLEALLPPLCELSQNSPLQLTESCGTAAAVSMATAAIWSRISFSSAEMAQVSITHYCAVLNNKYKCWQINETHRILSPEERLLASAFPRVWGSPAKLERGDSQIWHESGWQILMKCKLPPFHWSQQRCDNLHPLRFCHRVISALQITGNISQIRTLLSLKQEYFLWD